MLETILITILIHIIIMARVGTGMAFLMMVPHLLVHTWQRLELYYTILYCTILYYTTLHYTRS